jgi:hypothetical protein
MTTGRINQVSSPSYFHSTTYLLFFLLRPKKKCKSSKLASAVRGTHATTPNTPKIPKPPCHKKQHPIMSVSVPTTLNAKPMRMIVKCEGSSHTPQTNAATNNPQPTQHHHHHPPNLWYQSAISSQRVRIKPGSFHHGKLCSPTPPPG